MSQDWRYRNECQPYVDDAGKNLYIVVDSEYESLGSEKASRLAEAVQYGAEKLLEFYGKASTYDTGGFMPNMMGGEPTPMYANSINLILSSAVAEDYFVSYKPCVPMKVLVKVSKVDFDRIGDDTSACDIDKPAEGLNYEVTHKYMDF